MALDARRVTGPRVVLGDCLTLMAAEAPDTFDAIVTDPPYELGFMGRAWDRSGIAFNVDTWRAALRVAKPGAHLLAFGAPRNVHRLTCAIEDAGWEIRDVVLWLFGSGFPKSLDVSKAIDKAAGAEREEVGRSGVGKGNTRGPGFRHDGDTTGVPVTAPATDDARQWQGWGTALKPAYEPVVLARKPFPRTVAANVLEHGTGAINVDACRVVGDRGGGSWVADHGHVKGEREVYGDTIQGGRARDAGDGQVARWPANVTLDEAAARELDAQTGDLRSGGYPPAGSVRSQGSVFGEPNERGEPAFGATSGGASRFFYTAKASRAEREIGLESHDARTVARSNGGQAATARGEDYQGEGAVGLNRATRVKNHHPTVKPVDLMRWLVRLVTPPRGVILDPFCGSGSTGLAALAEGFRFVGYEKDPEYHAIATARVCELGPLFTETV